jgi:pimeloyl-ACP methyl ester carboxylesterase
VDGIHIHYYVAGPKDGQVVVLIHGLAGRAENWQNLAPYLVNAGYRVYMPDLPGFGRSERPPAFSYSVRDQAAVVTGFLDALRLQQVYLGGMSMGGWVVQLVASEHPERIRKLVLFDSAGLRAMPAWDTRLFTPNNTEEVRRFLHILMPHPPALPEFIWRDVVRVTKRNAWVVQRAMQTMLTGADATDALLPRLKMPVLIVWGTEDQIIPLSQGETTHRLVPQSKLELAPGCGHLAVMQCAGDIGPGLLKFLKD